MKYKVSIIVPVYNVEKYLRECLDSLVNQTLKEIEIICINDASPDNSLKILKEYNKNYPDLIKVIDLKKNVCLGGARNKGLDMAKGEYIAFVDSDDYVDVTMCEKLYNHAKKNDLDMLQFDYTMFGGKFKGGRVINFDTDLFSGGKLKASKNEFILATSDYMWSRIYKRKLWVKVRFPLHATYEDCSTFPFMVLLANKIGKLNNSFYYYRQHSLSITALSNAKTQMMLFSSMVGVSFMLKQARKLGIYNKYKNIFDERAVKIFMIEIWRNVNSGRFGCGNNLIRQVRQSELQLSGEVSNYLDIIYKSNNIKPRYKMLFFIYSKFPRTYQYILGFKSFLKNDLLY